MGGSVKYDRSLVRPGNGPFAGALAMGGTTAQVTTAFMRRPSVGAAAMSGIAPTVTNSAGSSAAWATQTPSYVSAVPGLAGHSLSSGFGFRPASGGAPTWYFITTNSGTGGTLVDTRTYECSLQFAANHNVSNKVVVDLTSGRKDYEEVSFLGDNLSVVGHCVRPDYGAVWALTGVCFFRGSHCHIQGCRIMLDPSGSYPGDLRRVITMNHLGNPWANHHNAITGCELYFGVDEPITLFELLGPADVHETAILFSLNHSVHPDGDHATGMYVGIEGALTLNRVFFNGGNWRAPMFGVKYAAYANSLIYAFTEFSGYFDNGRDSDPREILLAYNLYVARQTPSTKPLFSYDGALPSSSKVRAIGNQAHNFSGVSNSDQTSFLDSSMAASYTTGDPSNARPDGWGNNSTYAGLTTFAADSLAAREAFVEKFRTTVGAQPKYHGTVGYMDLALDQVLARLRNTGSGYGSLIDEPGDIGGIPTPTTFTINLANSTHVNAYHGGNTVPGVSTRDTVAGNGRTNGENWSNAIRDLMRG